MVMKCDVLVVGGGASGSVAALSLSKKGFDVIVIEKCSKVGLHTKDKIDITEETGLTEIIKELKLPIKDRTNKSKWFSPNHSLLLESKVHDLYFKRGASFDCFEVDVMKSALDNGATLFLNSEVKKINPKEESVGSVIIKENNKKQTIKPKIVFAADGYNSSMLKFMESDIQEKRIATISGYGTIGYDFDMPSSITYIFFDRKNVPGGYFYIAKSHDGECVACNVFDQSMISGNSKRYYDAIVNENPIIKKILNGSKVKTVFEGVSHAGFLNERTKKNVIFIGDAGRTLDPIFGYGVRNSIISGYIGADVASVAMKSEDFSKIQEYNTRLRSSISDIKQGAYLRKIYSNLNNNDFDKIVKLLSDMQRDGMNLDYLFSEKNYLIVKHILLNIKACTTLALKSISSIVK